MVTFIFLGLTCFLGCTPERVPTKSKITKAEAIELASHLVYGMREEDAVKSLCQNGLTLDMPGAGDSFFWNMGFNLADGGTLILSVRPSPFSPDGACANGRVEAAEICNWHGDVVARIKLKNSP